MGTEKIVGILGGMGPFATADFFKLIIQNTPAQKDWEHLRILMDNNVKIPSRTRAVLYNEESPVAQMVESINNLARIGADFIVVPCNSAHYFYEEVSNLINIPWLSIIDVTARKISQIGKKRPLILGGFATTQNRLYSKHIPEALYLSGDERSFVEQIIEEIKLTSNLCERSKSRLKSLLHGKRKSIDSVVLACTELPIIFNQDIIYGFKCINSSQEYACEVVRYARG